MLTIINDLHRGVSRQGGTTESSRRALKTFQAFSTKTLLDAVHGHLLIAGDLFDGFHVDELDFLEVYLELSAWLKKDETNELWLGAGNHDWSDKGEKVSHFSMLTTFLGVFPRVHVIQPNTWAQVGPDEDNVVFVAHHSNQDLFDETLSLLFGGAPRTVILHANYHNNFAKDSDQSLNVSEDVARDAVNAGFNLIFAHEHQSRSPIPLGARQDAGYVYVMGNQIPSSVSDCLSNDAKFYTVLSHDGYQKVKVWGRNDDLAPFTEIDWSECEDNHGTHGFIRVTGTVTREQSALMVQAISKLRQKSDAFVISNAVKIEGLGDPTDLPATIEDIKTFNVMDFIKAMTTPEQYAAIQELHQEANRG